jgi:hypothetical protein
MTKPKPPATVADRLAALEKRLSAVERQLKPTVPPVLPWWEVAYPEAYRNRKETHNG